MLIYEYYTSWALGGNEMNKKVLTDIKSVMGFITALSLSIASIIFAVRENQLWVVAIVFSLVILALSVRRAERLYREVQ
jgi:hypothetical protein